jgi:hypothetical protein
MKMIGDARKLERLVVVAGARRNSVCARFIDGASVTVPLEASRGSKFGIGWRRE